MTIKYTAQLPKAWKEWVGQEGDFERDLVLMQYPHMYMKGIDDGLWLYIGYSKYVFSGGPSQYCFDCSVIGDDNTKYEGLDYDVGLKRSVDEFRLICIQDHGLEIDGPLRIELTFEWDAQFVHP